MILLMDNPDICLYISQFLPDLDALRFTMCNVMINSLKSKVLFTDTYAYDMIKDLLHFNNFTSITINNNRITKFPLRIKSLTILGNMLSTTNFVNVLFPEGLEHLDMSSMLWNSDFSKIPHTLKSLKMPTHSHLTNAEDTYKLPFSAANVNLQQITMSSEQCHIFNKSLPKHLTNLNLYGIFSLRKGDIPDHITSLSIVCGWTERSLSKLIPLSIRYLTIMDADYDYSFGWIVERNMTLVINKKFESELDAYQWGPDFRVEYFD